MNKRRYGTIIINFPKIEITNGLERLRIFNDGNVRLVTLL